MRKALKHTFMSKEAVDRLRDLINSNYDKIAEDQKYEGMRCPSTTASLFSL
jgi:hypothetical protein